MSGRIYDNGINPICDKCGSKMWTSYDRNFNGAKCKRTRCDGNPIYKPLGSTKTPTEKIDKNGKYILEGVFTNFNDEPKNKYTIFERFRNWLFTIKENIINATM